MKLFFRKSTTPALPTPVTLSPEEAAIVEIERCVDILDECRRQFRDLQARFNLVVDQWGRIVFLAVPDVSMRATIEGQLREIFRREVAANQEFSQALRVRAGLQLKKEQEAQKNANS